MILRSIKPDAILGQCNHLLGIPPDLLIVDTKITATSEVCAYTLETRTVNRHTTYLLVYNFFAIFIPFLFAN